MTRPGGPLLRLAILVVAWLVVTLASPRADVLADPFRLEVRACTIRSCRTLPTRGTPMSLGLCWSTAQRIFQRLPEVPAAALGVRRGQRLALRCVPTHLRA